MKSFISLLFAVLFLFESAYSGPKKNPQFQVSEGEASSSFVPLDPDHFDPRPFMTIDYRQCSVRTGVERTIESLLWWIKSGKEREDPPHLPLELPFKKGLTSFEVRARMEILSRKFQDLLSNKTPPQHPLLFGLSLTAFLAAQAHNSFDIARALVPFVGAFGKSYLSYEKNLVPLGCALPEEQRYAFAMRILRLSLWPNPEDRNRPLRQCREYGELIMKGGLPACVEAEDPINWDFLPASFTTTLERANWYLERSPADQLLSALGNWALSYAESYSPKDAPLPLERKIVIQRNTAASIEPIVIRLKASDNFYDRYTLGVLGTYYLPPEEIAWRETIHLFLTSIPLRIISHPHAKDLQLLDGFRKKTSFHIAQIIKDQTAETIKDLFHKETDLFLTTGLLTPQDLHFFTHYNWAPEVVAAAFYKSSFQGQLKLARMIQSGTLKVNPALEWAPIEEDHKNAVAKGILQNIIEETEQPEESKSTQAATWALAKFYGSGEVEELLGYEALTRQERILQAAKYALSIDLRKRRKYAAHLLADLLLSDPSALSLSFLGQRLPDFTATLLLEFENDAFDIQSAHNLIRLLERGYVSEILEHPTFPTAPKMRLIESSQVASLIHRICRRFYLEPTMDQRIEVRPLLSGLLLAETLPSLLNQEALSPQKRLEVAARLNFNAQDNEGQNQLALIYLFGYEEDLFNLLPPEKKALSGLDRQLALASACLGKVSEWRDLTFYLNIFISTCLNSKGSESSRFEAGIEKILSMPFNVIYEGFLPDPSTKYRLAGRLLFYRAKHLSQEFQDLPSVQPLLEKVKEYYETAVSSRSGQPLPQWDHTLYTGILKLLKPAPPVEITEVIGISSSAAAPSNGEPSTPSPKKKKKKKKGKKGASSTPLEPLSPEVCDQENPPSLVPEETPKGPDASEGVGLSAYSSLSEMTDAEFEEELKRIFGKGAEEFLSGLS